MTKVNEYVKVAAAARFLGFSQTPLRKWADEKTIVARVNPKRASEPVATKPSGKSK